MSSEISVFAPAKVNLFLEVTGKRPNGYHNIATLFAKLAIGDDIKISAEKADVTTIELKVKGPFGGELKADKSNLAYKAAAAFFEHFGIKARCSIRLEKNIPIGSGLGGGSSDAAAVIMALCPLFNIETNSKRMKELVKLAAGLGADVPFFIFGENAWVEGIGEKLQAIQLPSAHYVVLTPKVHISTAEIFSSKPSWNVFG